MISYATQIFPGFHTYPCPYVVRPYEVAAETFQAFSLLGQNLKRVPDGEIFLKAARESRIVLTFDLDFGEILAHMGDRFVSVVLFRLHNTRSIHVISRLRDVLGDTSELLSKGAIVVVEEGRHRVRQIPLRGEKPFPAQGVV